MAADPNGFDHYRRGAPPAGLKSVDPFGFDHYRRSEPTAVLVAAAIPPQTVVLTQPSETELAQPVTALKTKAIGQASETDEAARAIPVRKAATKWASYTNDGSSAADFATAAFSGGTTAVSFAGNPVLQVNDPVPTDGFGCFRSLVSRDISESQVLVHISSPPVTGDSNLYFALISRSSTDITVEYPMNRDPSDFAAITVPGSDAGFDYRAEVRSTPDAATYNQTATTSGEAWLKISETAGTLHFWYSLDSITWTEIGTGTPSQPWMTDCFLEFGLYTNDTVTDFVEFDNINLPAAHLVGQPSETDIPQPIVPLKTKALGQATETDLAQPLTVPHIRLVNQATETDLAQPLTVPHIRLIGQATETDLVQALTSAKSVTLTQPSETDLAQPTTPLKTGPLGQPSETDLAQSVTASKTGTLVQAEETAEAQPVTALKTVTLGQPEETDEAQPIATSASILVPVGQAEETDQAGTVGLPPSVERLDYFRGDEVFGAQRGAVSTYGFDYWRGDEPHRFLTRRIVVPVEQPSETDTAQSLSAAKAKTLGFPIEVATCGPNGYGGDWGADFGGPVGSIGITVLRTYAIGQASETDLAQAITFVGGAKTRQIGQATEDDLAQTLTVPHVRLVGQVTETELAQPITALKVRAIGEPSETDLAQAITFVGGPKTRVLGQPSETDLAIQIAVIWRVLVATGSPDGSLTATGNPNGSLTLTPHPNGTLTSPAATPGTLVLTPHPDGTIP